MRGYVELLRTPGVVRLTAVQLFARLPMGMLHIAILMHVQSRSGSYAQAGAVVACVSIGQAVIGPMAARITGVLGPIPVLLATAGTNGVAMTALALAPPHVGVQAVLGGLIGATVPPLMAVMRALYPKLVPAEALGPIFALDTSAQELIWVVGPVAAALLAGSLSTAVPLFVAAAITIGGTIGFAFCLRGRELTVAANTLSFGRVLVRREVILAMTSSLALVASFTALEVALVAEYGSAGLTAGLAIAITSFGSMVGGILLGHRRFGVRGLVALLVVVATGTALVGIADGLAQQSVALFAAGFGFAPALAALYAAISRGVEASAAAETFGWLNSGALVGGAVGTALAGVASDAFGAQGSYVTATVLAGLAVVCPLAVRAAGPVRGLTVR